MTKVMVIGGTANPYGAEGEFLEVHLMFSVPIAPAVHPRTIDSAVRISRARLQREPSVI
jgi:hypothetical protein